MVGSRVGAMGPGRESARQQASIGCVWFGGASTAQLSDFAADPTEEMGMSGAGEGSGRTEAGRTAVTVQGFWIKSVRTSPSEI